MGQEASGGSAAHHRTCRLLVQCGPGDEFVMNELQCTDFQHKQIML